MKKIIKKIFGKSFYDQLDAENLSLKRFIEFVSQEVGEDERILDAGAGSCPYRENFSHARYESTDRNNDIDTTFRYRYDFLCSLDKIPQPDNCYDAVLCTQVLEHVEYPQKVIDEFYRVLKNNGKLFLTAPQGWGVHCAPHHYYNFTNFGLESLFRNAGFKIIFIKPRGGIFWYVGHRIRTIPQYILNQHTANDNKKSFRSVLMRILLCPVYFVFRLCCWLVVPLLCFYLDRLDKSQAYTLGYSCYCKKLINE